MKGHDRCRQAARARGVSEGKYDLLPDAKPIGETPWKDTFPVGYYVIAPNGAAQARARQIDGGFKGRRRKRRVQGLSEGQRLHLRCQPGDDMKKELEDYDRKFRDIIKFLDDDK